MRKIILSTFAAVALAAVSANADMSMKETTTTSSTSYSGTVSSLSPSSSTIILKSESAPAPMTYRFTEKTAWVDPSGATVSRELVQNQPVTVFYEKQGDAMIVTKVQTTKTLPMLEKKTTTTTTTESAQ